MSFCVVMFSLTKILPNEIFCIAFMRKIALAHKTFGKICFTKIFLEKCQNPLRHDRGKVTHPIASDGGCERVLLLPTLTARYCLIAYSLNDVSCASTGV